LSKETLDEVSRLNKEADQLLSQDRINEIVYLFDRLSDEEKVNCLAELRKETL
jgi:hypothetical protein